MSEEIKKPTSYETESDPMWLLEAATLVPWVWGKGADIGCGLRSPISSSIRVDIDERVKPEIISSGDKLPFADNELDYITSLHSLEHQKDAKASLMEWLRCVKTGGIVAIVHPDVQFTHKQCSYTTEEEDKNNPHNHHYKEHTLESFVQQLRGWSELPCRMIDHGPACPSWSFYVILKKI